MGHTTEYITKGPLGPASGTATGDSPDEATVRGGVVAGTRIATHLGWRPIEGVVLGDSALTFDGGLQKITNVMRRTFHFGETIEGDYQCMLNIPAGALGNQSDFFLVPDQVILFESDIAEELFGDPFALVPALALEGFNGIEREVPADPVDIISLQFDTDQIVITDFGAQLHCPAKSPAAALEALLGASVPGRYKTLSYELSVALIEEMAEAGPRGSF